VASVYEKGVFSTWEKSNFISQLGARHEATFGMSLVACMKLKVRGGERHLLGFRFSMAGTPK
jgi:hypothetical protein